MANGKFVLCASEDSHVYIWRYDADAQPSRSGGVVSVTQSYEHFHCRDVTVAVPWPSTSAGGISRTQSNRQNGVSRCNSQGQTDICGHEGSPSPSFRCNAVSQQNGILNTSINPFGDRVTATWPEEKLLASSNQSSPGNSMDLSNGRMQLQSRPAWGMVIVTAGRGGQIRTFQNFGFPV